MQPAVAKLFKAWILCGALLAIGLGLAVCGPASVRDQPFVKVEFRGQTGLIVGGASYLTLDDGHRWQRVDLSYIDIDDFDPDELRNRVQMVDAKRWFHAFRTILMTTENGGQSWQKVGEDVVTDIFFYDQRIGFANHNRKGGAKTSDGGMTWRPVEVRYLSDVCFWSEKEAYACFARELFETKDGGETWKLVREYSARIIRLKKNGEDLWLIGEEGLCVRYRPRTGEMITLDVPKSSTDLYGAPVLFDIGFNGKKIIVVGRGLLYVSLDSAFPNWEKVAVESNEDFVSVDFSSDGTAFVVGGRSGFMFRPHHRTALKSNDYQNWKQVDLPE